MSRSRRALTTSLVVAVGLCLGCVALVWSMRLSAGGHDLDAVPPGVPDQPITLASFNTLSNLRGEGRVLADLRELDADFLLLQEVQATDVARMAGALGMEHRYVPATFPPDANVRDGSPSRGNAILSRHRMTSATSLQHPGGGSFGLRVDAEVAGRRFTVACVHLSATWRVSPSHLRESGAARHREISHLLDDWQRRGAHPLIVGGDFNQIPFGDNYALMTEHLTDALSALGLNDLTFGSGAIRTRIDYFLASDEWRLHDGGVVPTAASDHKLIWLTVGGT